ncbi:hypothetical protein FPRO03_13838 [Fusarium proliferatum]|nr:hypothetical protein FPRO03_13838 [Fusarium proliferatum]
MVFDAQMYQIADKYDIPALKAQSKNKFNVAVTTGWSMDDFPHAITVVYESTPPEDRGLRDLVVQTARKNINKLLGHDGFCELKWSKTGGAKHRGDALNKWDCRAPRVWPIFNLRQPYGDG